MLYTVIKKSIKCLLLLILPFMAKSHISAVTAKFVVDGPTGLKIEVHDTAGHVFKDAIGGSGWKSFEVARKNAKMPYVKKIDYYDTSETRKKTLESSFIELLNDFLAASTKTKRGAGLPGVIISTTAAGTLTEITPFWKLD